MKCEAYVMSFVDNSTNFLKTVFINIDCVKSC